MNPYELASSVYEIPCTDPEYASASAGFYSLVVERGHAPGESTDGETYGFGDGPGFYSIHGDLSPHEESIEPTYKTFDTGQQLYSLATDHGSGLSPFFRGLTRARRQLWPHKPLSILCSANCS